MKIVTKPGWIGHWIEGQVEGAFPNGSRVAKGLVGDDDDAHKPGARATVISSVMHPDPKFGLAYFVEWDDTPKAACLVVAKKLVKL